MKKTIYRTVIKLEVLSDEPIPSGIALGDIVSQCDEGDYSGAHELTVDNQPVSGKRAATLVLNQGSDPEFFNMDHDGNVMEE